MEIILISYRTYTKVCNEYGYNDDLRKKADRNETISLRLQTIKIVRKPMQAQLLVIYFGWILVKFFVIY